MTGGALKLNKNQKKKPQEVIELNDIEEQIYQMILRH